MCLGIGTLEVISILVRKKNTLLLVPAAFQQAMLAFRSEVVDAADFSKIAVIAAFVSAAALFVEKHSLNATDALVLASASEIASVLRAAGEDVVLMASDQ